MPNKLHYIRFGNGPRFLIAFHGFADRAELFLNLRYALEDRFTVIAIDLPFHGQSNWPLKEFTPDQLRDSINEILEKESISGEFTLMGHSMGGRIILGINEYFKDRIEAYIMLSPAGFQGAKSDSKLLFPKFIRKFLKLLTSKPIFVLTIFRFGRLMGLINRGTLNFLKKQFEFPERRKRLFDCWISLYNFPIDLKSFKKNILENKISIHFFYGNKDYITPAKYASKFIADVPGAALILVEDGHYFLKAPLAEALSITKI
jgi:pimeloyl-ACP methyl ester carboxylesterase